MTDVFNGKDKKAVAQAAALISAGNVVAIPTETVYGLAANALDAQAVQRIFDVKGRPQDNPLIVHIANRFQLDELVREVPKQADKLAQKFWPGPLTMVFYKSDKIPDAVSAGLDTVAVRIPAHPVAQAIIKQAGVPIAAPSANLSGKPSTTTAEHVFEDLNGKITAIVDGGPCMVGVESTVIDFTRDTPCLLRPGGISKEQIEAIIGKIDVASNKKIDKDTAPRAPGMKYKHYAPKAPITLIRGDAEKTAHYMKQQAKPEDGILCFDEYKESFDGQATVISYGNACDFASQAQKLFDALRAFDKTKVSSIYVQCPEEIALGTTIANRLKKAATTIVSLLPQESNFKIVGLTGASGAGKSQAARYFETQGIKIIDADRVYAELCQNSHEMLQEIETAFPGVLTKEGTLNRKKLAHIVFSSKAELEKLNRITHPCIGAAVLALIFQHKKEGAKAVIYDAATLFEMGGDAVCDATIGLIASKEIRCLRIQQRDGLSRQAAQERINGQPNDEFYISRCDYIVENSGTMIELIESLDQILKEVMEKETSKHEKSTLR